MPSPCPGKMYRRKGGAWKKSKNGKYKKVGYGKGTYSKHDTAKDAKRHARRSSKRRRYPQEYD